MSKTRPTATMIEAVRRARIHGDELVRHQGGYWAPRGTHPLTSPYRSFGDGTINGLVDRGFAEFIEWQEGRNGRFPIAMRLRAAAGLL